MSFSFAGYYMDDDALRKFAAEQDQSAPPKRALKMLYDYCDQEGQEIDFDEIFTDCHTSWFDALDEAVKQIGFPEDFSFWNIMDRKTPPFPYPYDHNNELSFGYLSAAEAKDISDKLQDAEKQTGEAWDDEVRNGLVIFRERCNEAVKHKKSILFLECRDWEKGEEETPPEEPTERDDYAAGDPRFSFLKLISTIFSIPLILHYLGVVQIGLVVCGNLSGAEFVEKWHKLFEMEIGYFLIIFPPALYLSVLLLIWGRFRWVVRKRLFLLSLLLLTVSFITLYRAFPGLVKNEAIICLITGIVLWKSRTK